MTSSRSVLLKASCMECGQRDQISVDSIRYELFRSGTFVQDAWPHLSAGHRELILGATSGIYMCGHCWDKMAEEGG